MKIQLVSSLMIFLLFFVNVQSLLAANRQAEDEVKARASQALAKDREVLVKLKTATVYRGKVVEVLQDSFTLQTSGAGLAHTINYADVASIKVQSGFASGLGKFGKGLAFLFTTKTGLVLISASLTVARLIYVNNQYKRHKNLGLTRIE